jgi:HEXXH motif-containing protein
MIPGNVLPSPRATRRLMAEIARRTAARLGRLVRRRSGGPPGAAPIFSALLEGLSRLPREARDRLLCGPDLRGFLAEFEAWTEVGRLAADTSRRARGRRAGRDRGAERLERLFDRVSRTEHLRSLLPFRRIDAGFARRSSRFAGRRLGEAMEDLASFALGLRLARPGPGRFSARLAFRADPEQGRRADRIDLGTLATGPAGPLSIRAADRRPPPWLRARLEGGTLFLAAPGHGGSIFPLAGSRLRLPPGRRSASSREPFLLERRPVIPGTSILVAPAIRSSSRGLRVGRNVPGLASRLAQALRIVRLAWPDAHAEILSQTFVVVPVRERGLVSYSLASRPGVSFVNDSGKTLVDLADDLLHESAHHRLHALQEIEALLAPGPETTEVQAFASPWRGTRRPLHGILHGAYTFLYRAELFRRLLRAVRSRPRLFVPLLRPRGASWIDLELRREVERISASMRDLERAGREGLLRPEGRRLVREMRRAAEALARPAGRSGLG